MQKATQIMTDQQPDLMTIQQLSSFKRFLSFLLERGKINLLAYVEVFQQLLTIHMDDTWTIHDVFQKEGLFSFHASVEDQMPFLFVIKDEEAQGKLETWITSMQVLRARTGAEGRENCIIVPDEIIFLVYTRLYVSSAQQKAAALAV
jgi:hypothetical protein